MTVSRSGTRSLTVLFLFLCVLITANLAGAGVSEGEGQGTDGVLRLTIEEGKLMVIRKNLDISITRLGPEVEDENIRREKGLFDPSFTASFFREDYTLPLSSRYIVYAGGRTTIDSQVRSVSAGFDGRTPVGTEYSIEFDDSWTKDNFNANQPEYEAFAGIRITQPLLKDFGLSANYYNVNIARKNKDISLSELKQRVIDTIAEFKTAYWDVVLAMEDVKVKEESLKLARSLLELNQKRLEAEVISPMEITEAEAGVAVRSEDLIIAQNMANQKKNILKRLISDDVSSLKGVDILPTDVPEVIPVSIDQRRSVSTALENRPDYLGLKAEIEKSDINIRYAKNQLYPDIDLEASYGYNGLGDTFDESWEDIDAGPEWTVGVVLRVPLGNRTAGSDLKIARLEARKALLNLKKLEQEIVIEIDNVIREIYSNEKRIEAARISTRLSEELLRAEELKLKEGLSTSHDVLELEEDLSEAKLREINAVIDFNKSLVKLSRVKGVLLEDEGIRIAEDVQAQSGRSL